MEAKKDLLVTLADIKYVEPAKQLFSSAYWNAGWKGNYMLLAQEIPKNELMWFKERGILVKTCVPLYGRNEQSKTTLSKFYLFTSGFKEWKNIIFLDADIIVRASLDGLTKIKGFAACSGTSLKEQLLKKPNLKKIFKELRNDYDLKERALNSGVMAFNTDIIEENTLSKLRQIHERYKDLLKCEEQGTLALFFYKKFIKLPYLYNCWPHHMKNVYRIRPEKIRAVILHFMSNTKPWLPDSFFNREWRNNLDKADLINLKKIPSPRDIISEQEIQEYEECLNSKKKIGGECFFWRILWDLTKLIERHKGIIKAS